MGLFDFIKKKLFGKTKKVEETKKVDKKKKEQSTQVKPKLSKPKTVKKVKPPVVKEKVSREKENKPKKGFLTKIKEAIISKIPSSRLGSPDDIANAALFLCSNRSNYINGETLHVNGGMYMA